MRKQPTTARTSPRLSLTRTTLRTIRGGDGAIARADDEDEAATPARRGYDIKVNTKV